jgi:spermidine synthase
LLFFPLLFIIHSISSFSAELVLLRAMRTTFGNTSYAASAVFLAVFIGFAVGAWFWGKRSETSIRPLRTFWVLEFWRAIAAISGYVLIHYSPILHWVISSSAAENPVLVLLIQFFAAIIILFPWAFFWGGQFPLVAAWLYATTKRSALWLTTLYCIDAAGAWVAIIFVVFGLLPSQGMNATILFATTAGVGVAVAGWWRYLNSRITPSPALTPAGKIAPSSKWRDSIVAAISGFGTLGLELLLLRAYLLVTNSSVYTDAITLGVFIACLSLGAGINIVWLKFRGKSVPIAFSLMVTVVLLLVMPLTFSLITEGVLPIYTRGSWQGYLLSVFSNTASLFILPITAAGMVFPSLLASLSESTKNSRCIGSLMVYNTIGAAVAIIVFGFAISPLSLWNSVWLIAAIYTALSVWLAFFPSRGLSQSFSRLWAGILAGFVLLCFSIGAPELLQQNVSQRDMKVIDITEQGGSVTAVVGSGDRKHILINNQYSVGSNTDIASKRFQTILPLLLHPAPKDVCFIGMGTGITAGAALFEPSVSSVTVCEILPGVISMAKKHFAPYVNNLFNNKRVTLLSCDGRSYLTYTNRKFDLIISELFIPWQSGTANLYTADFYTIAASRLNENGLFIQWLPGYQITKNNFEVIAKTFSSCFSNTTLWRSDFDSGEPVFAFVGQKSRGPIDGKAILQKLEQNPELYRQALYLAGVPDDVQTNAAPFLALYCGNLNSGTKQLWPDAPTNTDDKLPIEFTVPVPQRQVDSGAVSWVVDDAYHKICAALVGTIVPNVDIVLPLSDMEFMQIVRNGYYLAVKE